MLRCCNLDFLPLDCSRDYKLQIVYNTWHFLTLTCTIAAENAAQNHSGVWTGRNKAKGSPAQIVCQKGGGPKYLLWVVTTGLPTVVICINHSMSSSCGTCTKEIWAAFFRQTIWAGLERFLAASPTATVQVNREKVKPYILSLIFCSWKSL